MSRRLTSDTEAGNARRPAGIHRVPDDGSGFPRVLLGVNLRDRRGVTLIELMVVIIIIAVVLAVSVPMIGARLGGDVRKSSKKLGATLQIAYDECALRHVPLRLAYNLDQHAYWVEEATGEVRLFETQAAREDWIEQEEERQEEIEDWKERDQQMKERIEAQHESEMNDPDNPMSGLLGMLGLQLGTGSLEPAPRLNEFVPIEDTVFKLVELPPQVRFMGVWSPQWDEVVEPQQPPPEEDDEDLIVYTHIFPEGYMEDTVIYLIDRREMVMSLVIEPLTGRVIVELGEADPPRREARSAD